jgi:hypothetical protein
VTSHNKMLNIVRYALWVASQQAALRPLALSGYIWTILQN